MIVFGIYDHFVVEIGLRTSYCSQNELTAYVRVPISIQQAKSFSVAVATRPARVPSFERWSDLQHLGRHFESAENQRASITSRSQSSRCLAAGLFLRNPRANLFMGDRCESS
jgi:hypothetical protein